MTPAEALETLELSEGSPPDAIDRAYETLYNDVQLRIQNAPTPKLRSRFEERLVQIEAAYALLRGNATSDEDLPSSGPVDAPGAPTGAEGPNAGRRPPRGATRPKEADGRKQKEERAAKRKRVAVGVVGFAVVAAVGAFLLLGGQSAGRAGASDPVADSVAIASLLGEARAYLAMDALDSPPGANAHETLTEIESVDPANPAVRELRAELANKYFEIASAAADSSHWAEAAEHFSRMAAVAAEESAEKRLALARQAEAVQRRDEVERARSERIASQQQASAAAAQQAAAQRQGALRQAAANRSALQAQYGNIHTAARQGSVEGVEAFLSAGVGANTPDESGMTPLNHAVLAGHEAVARHLIQRGASVNTQNRRGTTPLHAAATIGHESLARLLIESGANVNARDQLFGETPLKKALENGHNSVASLLQRYGGQ